MRKYGQGRSRIEDNTIKFAAFSRNCGSRPIWWLSCSPNWCQKFGDCLTLPTGVKSLYKASNTASKCYQVTRSPSSLYKESLKRWTERSLLTERLLVGYNKYHNPYVKLQWNIAVSKQSNVCWIGGISHEFWANVFRNSRNHADNLPAIAWITRTILELHENLCAWVRM